MIAEAATSSIGYRKPVLLLVGWDGATPELLERFVDAGRLPTVERLMKRGGFRRLRSTIPPVTACAWCSFLTGKNPGKHGLFDFVTPARDSYKFEYTLGAMRKDREGDILALLNKAGLHIGCVNVPMTFPPRKIAGFMISGLDAPDEKSGIAHPADVFEQVQNPPGVYRIDNRHLGAMKDNHARLEVIEEFKRIETVRTDVTLAMIERCPVDVLAIVYNATDQVQHHFWHLMDPAHPQHDAEKENGRIDPRLTSAIRDIYEHCDRELARLMEAFPDADVMLMSDHGAGPTSGPRVRINNALAQAGLLKWAGSSGGVVSDMVGKFDSFLRRNLSAKQKAMLSRLLPGGRSRIESMGLAPVDWAGTLAFSYEGFTLSPCVWINRKNLFPQGTVAEGREYDAACERVIKALTALKDPQTGEQVIPRVHKAREVYDGEYVPGAPDLILDWWEGRTFTMTKSHPRHDGESPVLYPPPRMTPGQDITGIHRRDGVLAFGGPHLRQAASGSLPPADLIDIIPTTLRLLGLDVPGEMDGRVLDELVAGTIDVTGESTPVGAPTTGEETYSYSEQDQKIIEERLSGLGYIE